MFPNYYSTLRLAHDATFQDLDRIFALFLASDGVKGRAVNAHPDTVIALAMLKRENAGAYPLNDQEIAFARDILLDRGARADYDALLARLKAVASSTPRAPPPPLPSLTPSKGAAPAPPVTENTGDFIRDLGGCVWDVVRFLFFIFFALPWIVFNVSDCLDDSPPQHHSYP